MRVLGCVLLRPDIPLQPEYATPPDAKFDEEWKHRRNKDTAAIAGAFAQPETLAKKVLIQ